jgi:hypothetical protein
MPCSKLFAALVDFRYDDFRIIKIVTGCAIICHTHMIGDSLILCSSLEDLCCILRGFTFFTEVIVFHCICGLPRPFCKFYRFLRKFCIFKVVDSKLLAATYLVASSLNQ